MGGDFSNLVWRKNLSLYYYYLNKFQFCVLLSKLDFVLTQMRNLPNEMRAKVLGWSIRFNITCGIVRGFLYLHKDPMIENYT